MLRTTTVALLSQFGLGFDPGDVRIVSPTGPAQVERRTTTHIDIWREGSSPLWNRLRPITFGGDVDATVLNVPVWDTR